MEKILTNCTKYTVQPLTGEVPTPACIDIFLPAAMECLTLKGHMTITVSYHIVRSQVTDLHTLEVCRKVSEIHPAIKKKCLVLQCVWTIVEII